MDVRILRTVGVIALVVLIVILGLPLAIGMGGAGNMGRCPECQASGGFPIFGICLAILGTILLFSLSVLGEAVGTRSRRFTAALSDTVERPPRSFSL